MITSAEEMSRIEKIELLERFGKYTEESLFEADDNTLNEVSQEMIDKFLDSDIPSQIEESDCVDLENDNLSLGEILRIWTHKTGELIE